MKAEVTCDYCQKPAELVRGNAVYAHRPDLYHKKFWLCKPCNAFVGCHPKSDAVPLGSLANAELRTWRHKAHLRFDPLWKDHGNNRKECYLWLAQEMGIDPSLCHIGMFSVEQCQKVIEICRMIK